MTLDRGEGPPLLLIPGIQGRWEWIGDALDLLAARHRVFGFSLGDVPCDGAFDRWVAHIDRLLPAAAGRVGVVGISFGGLVAACYAARRPDRVSRLILVSTPPPGWRLDPRLARYARHPRLALPLFALRAARSFLPETAAALPGWRSRVAFAARNTARAARWPVSPSKMAAWVGEWARNADRLAAEFRRIPAETLLITGERDLDRVVPVERSLEYLDLIAGARHATLPRTGHVGLLTRPADFAALVSRFATGTLPGQIPRTESAENLERRCS